MRHLLNLGYLAALLVAFPWLTYKALTTGKYRRGVWHKLSGCALSRTDSRPCAWFHGVSVGEIHLLRQLVAAFQRRHPDWNCVISTTTDTGYEEACKRFPDLPVFYWPLDFSWAVRRALRRVRPSLVVLAEGETWPNFLLAAKRFGVPVAIVNGRMSPRSAGRYRFLTRLVRPLFARLDLIAAQTDDYAACYRALGAPAERVHVTGSVKYDGVETDRDNPRTRQLRELLAVHPDDLVWIAGSTQAPEEEIALAIYRRLKQEFPPLRLFLVPRQRERFDEVATLLQRAGISFTRRSQLSSTLHAPRSTLPVVLVDTIGELGALWGLADVAFVGGSLDGRRGGQNMIEPAAYGAAVVFGPHVWNFRDTAAKLVGVGAAVRVPDAKELEAVVRSLLANRAERDRMGQAARSFVARQQGATDRTMTLLDALLTGQTRQAA